MKYDPNNSIDKNKAQMTFDKFLEKGWKFELKRIFEKRTVSQNNYLHVCLSLAGIHFGYSLDEMKTVFKRQSKMYYEKNGEKFLISSADLNKDEMTGFIDFIRSKCGQDGCYIPTSEEYLTNQFSIDKEIELQKEYL